MNSRFVTTLLLLAATPCLAQDSSTPQLTGYVTATTVTGDFEVNGQHVTVSDKTSIKLQQPDAAHGRELYSAVPTRSVHISIGEPVDIYGKGDKASHTIRADQIIVHARQPHKVSGIGIVDAILPLPPDAAGVSIRLIRADGYRVLLNISTLCSFEKPLNAVADVAVNEWVHFSGVERNDGTVLADEAHFSANQVHSMEGTLIKKSEYDPEAVPADSKQGHVSKFFRGIDVKQIPPSADTAMQARLTRIGVSLIPKYQMALAKTDPTRIDFRFQVLDDNKDTAKWRDARTLPNGIILIPHLAVERMQNDSQLAAVLADNIACALEKQPLAKNEMGKKMTLAQIAGAAGGIFIPGLGLATSVGNAAAANHMLHESEDQSGRVSLWLLKDAGYDIYQAPMAWWLLAPKKPKAIVDTPLPRRAANLYQFLGESWPTDEDAQTQNVSAGAVLPVKTSWGSSAGPR